MIGRLLACFAVAGTVAGGSSAADTLPGPTERVVAIDWGLAETLVAIGVPPLGLPETRGYNDWVRVPPMPDSTADLGLRSTPSLEYIAGLDADVILTTPQFASITPVVEQAGPVVTLEIYSAELEPYRNAVDVTRRIGAIVGHEEEAERLIADTASHVERLAAALDGFETRKVLIVNFNDDRHVRVFGEGSIYDDVLERAGLGNAWTAPGNFWGFTLISIDQLVGLEDAAVLVIEPVPPSIQIKLDEPDAATLIGQMEVFEEGGYRVLPSIWGFGGLPSARRFAEVLLDNVDFLKAGHES